MDTVLGGAHSIYRFDLLLEIKRDGEEFPVYESGGALLVLRVIFHTGLNFQRVLADDARDW